MSYQYRFCPTCGTQRVAFTFRCSVCGGCVRRAERPVTPAAPAEPLGSRPYSAGWQIVARAEPRKIAA